MNICLINDSFPPIIDGVSNAVYNYATNIQDVYGNAIVATPQYPGAVDDYNFPVIRYPSVDTTKRLGYRTGYPFAPDTIGQIVGQKPDLIHSHCPVTATVLARLLRDSVDAPIVMTYHTRFEVDIARAVDMRLIQEAAIKLMVENISACDEVWAVSTGAGESLKSLGFKGDYVVMENGVDLPRGRVDKDITAALSKEYGLAEDVPLFIFVGRIMWYKGIDLILDALGELKEHGHDYRMVFVGDGLELQRTKDRAAELKIYDRCIFTGAIHDRERLRAWYSRADLLLFPSTYDTNGLVVREAAACGLGSLIIEGSCASEGIIGDRNGILVSQSSRHICARLEELIKNPSAMKNIGQRAMDEIYISWQESVRRACERYTVVIDRYKRGHYTRRQPTDEILSVMGDLLETLDKLWLADPPISGEKLRSIRRQLMDHFGRDN